MQLESNFLIFIQVLPLEHVQQLAPQDQTTSSEYMLVILKVI